MKEYLKLRKVLYLAARQLWLVFSRIFLLCSFLIPSSFIRLLLLLWPLPLCPGSFSLLSAHFLCASPSREGFLWWPNYEIQQAN